MADTAIEGFSRLQAVSLFPVVRRPIGDTQMATRVTDGPRFTRLAASLLPRACIALTKSEEKERLLAASLRFQMSC